MDGTIASLAASERSADVVSHLDAIAERIAHRAVSGEYAESQIAFEIAEALTAERAA
jgi:hypothetical protein